MSKYTVQLRNLLENDWVMFDFDYPIFDPTYKGVLEQKIKDYFYFREIGFETPAQFKHYLKVKLNLIMPYYNEFYLSNEVFKTYDPYKNKNVTTTDTKTNTVDSNGTSTSSGTNNETETYSDTPQATLQGKDYATTITKQTGDSGGTTTNTAKVTTTDQYTSTIAGHDGMKYPTDILMGLRQTFINIDKMIIDELESLFMGIY